MRASLNVRLSRMANDANLSKDGMLEDLRALAARNNFQVVAEHVDDGISGAIRDRPGFQDWLADAREGRADVLLAWHVDRMTREGLQVATMLLDVTEGKDRDGRIVHPPVRLMDTTGLDSARGESFRLEFVIKAEIARAERERMKARSKARVERMKLPGETFAAYIARVWPTRAETGFPEDDLARAIYQVATVNPYAVNDDADTPPPAAQ